MDRDRKICVGIDASRNRSGGARVHLIGLIGHLDPARHGISEVHVWAYADLLNALPDHPWLHKHNPAALQAGLLAQVLWQRFKLDQEAKAAGCDILFSASASTVARFVPLVVLSQDMLSYERGVASYFGFGKARLRLILIGLLQNAAFRRSAGVIFLTRYAANVIQRSCGPLSRVSIVPHGVDDTFRAKVAAHRWPSGGKEIVCTYVSGAEMYKHQWTVVEAIAALRKQGHNVKLLLIGGGGGKAQALLARTIRACDPRREFVTQKEFVSRETLADYLRSTDVFVFASSCENLPVTLLEGMAAGLPIACSDRGPMPEVLENGGVFFDPQHAPSIAAAIEQLIQDPERRHNLASTARQLADRYSWHVCAAQTFEFIVDTYWSGKVYAKS